MINKTLGGNMDSKELIQKMYKYEEGLLKQRYESVKEKDVERIFDMMQNPTYIEILQEDMDLLIDLVRGPVYVDNEIANFYMFSKTNDGLDNIWIDEARDLVEDLMFYSHIKCGDYLFYFDKKYLVEIAKKILENSMCEPKYFNKYLAPYLSKEKIVELLLEGRFKSEAVEDLIDKVDIEILLNLNPKPAFKTSEGQQIYYSYIEDLKKIVRM